MYRWCSVQVIGPYLKNTDILHSPLDANYVPDKSWGYNVPTPPRVEKPISYMANSLSTDLLGANSVYFPPTVTNYNGPIAPGSYWDGSSPNRVPNTPPTSTTQPTNPASLIVFTTGSEHAAAWAGCPNEENTETIAGCYGMDDLFWGWDVYSFALGSYYGSPDPNLAVIWRTVANQSNFAFSDGHAKSMNPGQFIITGLQLNPKYFLVDSTGF
jgi:prepilin-type processing-associated H-X9-DG protein